jgi:hypothetical protein
MSLRRFTALQFRRPMDRGLNQPFLVIGKSCSNKTRENIVVKSRAGYADRPDAMLRELFGLLLARELGLKVPEPILVELQAGFDWCVIDYPDHAELIRQSVGWNLGTIHLGNAWKPWSVGSKPRSLSAETLETAYAFDAMVQNSDREADNPNMLWRGDELTLLDFDKAFAYLRKEEQEDRPWRKTLINQNLGRHSLYPHLPALTEGKIIGRDLWDFFEEWWMKDPSGQLSQVISAGMPDPDLDLPRLECYLRKLSAAADDFFPYLTEASRS